MSRPCCLQVGGDKVLPVHPAVEAAQLAGKKRRGVKRYVGIGAQASSVDQALQKADRASRAGDLRSRYGILPVGMIEMPRPGRLSRPLLVQDYDDRAGLPSRCTLKAGAQR